MQQIITRKRAIYSIGALFVLAVTLFLLFSTKPAVYDIDRNVKYSFTLTNKSNMVKRDLSFYVYAPVNKTSSQLAAEIKSTLPFTLTKDGLGNQLMHFEIDVLPPYANKIVTITAKLRMASLPNQKKLYGEDIYILPEKYIESDNEKLVAITKQLEADDEIKTLKNALQWVHSNIKYVGYIKDDRGALYALNNRKGDCTEYMYLFTAMARAMGVPARGVAGYVYSEDAVFKPGDFHNWSEIYIDGKWRVVDPQNGKFLENDSHYIAMRILSDKVSLPNRMNNTQQFAVSEPGINIRMN